MLFHSTRKQTRDVRAADAILRGLAADGGLFVPDKIPQVDWTRFLDYSYAECASEILGLYFDFDPADLRRAADVYAGRFPQNPCPVQAVRRVEPGRGESAPAEAEKDYVLELFHGPTLAFKDFALAILPGLMQLALERREAEPEPSRADSADTAAERMLILTATSGDTGKAALEGFAGSSRISVMVFYPERGVSPMQRLQMMTQEGEHAFVYGIEGDFDDAQNAVKRIFNLKELTEELARDKIRLSSANSINIGRLIPQITYYVWGYLELVRKQAIRFGEAIDVAVPTGNFGNILAARYAKAMGLPLRNLICASNDNHILTDFFRSGEYDKRRDLLLTSSPSMDILISSNLERYLYLLDPAQVRPSMQSLQEEGHFRWQGGFPDDLRAYYADETEISRMIAACHAQNYLIDPHTAVAFSAVEQERARNPQDRTVCLIAATASPFKFPRKVLEAIGCAGEADRAALKPVPAVPSDGSAGIAEADFDDLQRLSELSGQPIPQALADLRSKPVRHAEVIAKEAIESVVRAFARTRSASDR